MERKTIYAVLLAAVLIAVIVLLVKFIGGAVTVVNAGFNTVLGVVLVLALVILVVWMFLYARKK